MKPWFNQQTAVFACAFAMYGRARAPAAATPTDPASTLRRLIPTTAALLPCCRPLSAPAIFWIGFYPVWQDYGDPPSVVKPPFRCTRGCGVPFGTNPRWHFRPPLDRQDDRRAGATRKCTWRRSPP